LYSPLLFGPVWMKGLGLTQTDISEAQVNIGLALATSALSSLMQSAALVWLFSLVPVTLPLGALIGALAALTFGGGPMLRDRVWADRPWSVIAVDLGHEIAAGALAGALAAWWLG
jgi:hypothetical protein